MTQTASGVLIRYGEVFLKKGRKQYFLDVLAGQLERALFRVDPTLKLTRPYGRYLIVPKDESARIQDPQAVAEALSRVFGAVWAGPVEIVRDPTPSSLEKATIAYAKVHRKRSHRTFKVTTKRADKNFPLTSVECGRKFGSAVWEELGGLDVDLDNPDLEIRVEIRTGIAFVFGAGVRGVGGLPVGSNGRALLLLSGGIDSPVAGWLTQKRGVAVDALTFLSPPYTGPQAREKVEALARILARSQKRFRLWVVELTPIQEQCKNEAPGNQLVLLYRRSMFRIAEKLAEQQGHLALVTGDNLGQVASQTLPNLHCTGSVAERPVLRPLLTYDKYETIALAREIGTYDTSILPYEDCCSLFVPLHPELTGSVSVLEKHEQGLQLDELESSALENADVVSIAP